MPLEACPAVVYLWVYVCVCVSAHMCVVCVRQYISGCLPASAFLAVYVVAFTQRE